MAAPGLSKKPSSGTNKPVSAAAKAAADKALDHKLEEAAAKLRSKAVDFQIWKRFEEPLDVSSRMAHAPLNVRICNAAYLGDMKSLNAVLEQSKMERIRREMQEREEEERVRIAQEAEEWTVDVRGHKTRKHHQHHMHGHGSGNGSSSSHANAPPAKVAVDADGKPLTPEQLKAESEREYAAKLVRDQAERERKELERALRTDTMDEPALVRFQFGEEGIRVVRTTDGKYSFRLDSFGVPAPALFYACMSGQIEAVRALKKYKANLSATIELRWPAHKAHDSGDTTPASAAPPGTTARDQKEAAAQAAAHAGVPIGAQPTAYGEKVTITAWDVAFENGHHDVAKELGSAKRQCRACTSPASPCLVS